MATNSGTLVLHVSSTSRLRYSYDREAQVNEAVQKLSNEGKRVVNIVDGPITPFGPLGNVYSDVTIIWEINQNEYSPSAPTESIASIKPVEKASVVVTSDNYASVLSRIDLFLEDEEWEKAKSYCDAALDFNSTSADVYLRLVLAEEQLHDFNELCKASLIPNNNRNFEKAIRFSEEPLKAKLLELKAKWESNAESYQGQSVITDHKHKERSISPERMLGAGYGHSVGLKTDGTVLATRYSGNPVLYCGECDVSSWTNIIEIASGANHTVGLKADGTVVATKYCGKDVNKVYYGQCEVAGWTDIISVAVGDHHTLGLKKNGKVVAVGYNSEGACNVSGWENIVAISAGENHSVGLKADGTVVATGFEYCGRCNVSGFRNIVAISAGRQHTVGLKSDGTVVSTHHTDPKCYAGQCDVSSWNNIVAVSAGDFHTVGIRADGTVVSTRFIENGQWIKHNGQCNVSEWRDIVAVVASSRHTLGLNRGGFVVSTKYIERDFKYGRYCGQCEVSGWKLFDGHLNSTEDINKAFAYKTARLAAAKRKEEEEIRKQEEELREAKRRYEEYWTKHAEEKEKLLSEKTSMEVQIRSTENSLVKFINSQSNSIPSAEEVTRLEETIKNLTAEKAKLGLFNGKQKKELQNQIDKANAEKADAQKRAAEEKTAIETRIISKKKETEAEISRLKLRIKAIDEELAKDR